MFYFNQDLQDAPKIQTPLDISKILEWALKGVSRTIVKINGKTITFDSPYKTVENVLYTIKDGPNTIITTLTPIDDMSATAKADISSISILSTITFQLPESNWSVNNNIITNGLITINMASSGWQISKYGFSTKVLPININSSNQGYWSLFIADNAIILKLPISQTFINQLHFVIDRGDILITTREGSNVNILGLNQEYPCIRPSGVGTVTLTGYSGLVNSSKISSSTTWQTNLGTCPIFADYLPIPYISSFVYNTMPKFAGDKWFYSGNTKVIFFNLLDANISTPVGGVIQYDIVW